MITRIIACLLLFACCHSVPAADPKYPVSEVPPALLRDAKAVIRKNDIVFEISAIDKAVEKVTIVITILNKNGVDNAILVEGYDKFSSIRKIQTSVYDKDGIQIKSGLNTTVMDIASVAGYSLYEDNRVKVYDPEYTTTPYTVEYSFERVYNGLLSYPAWIIYPDFNISVQESSFTVSAPEGFGCRFFERNISNPCTTVSQEGNIKKSWAESNQPALKEELYGANILDYIPFVIPAPDDFKIGGYQGSAKTWKDFGLWIKKLNEDRNQLEPETSTKIKSIVMGVENKMEKVRILYKYMQDKVRYVSIQQGIGGWQPIDAKTVDKVSYGDCKALANYMKSLLDAAGIHSVYTLVRAGEDAPVMLQDFPSNQFNHAILCVPLESDTIWLECTDQRIPFGFLGSFTDDRNVLLITDSGGVVVKTRLYDSNDNAQYRKASVMINNDGSAFSTVNSEYRGIKYDDESIKLRIDDTDKKKLIHEKIKLPDFNLVSYSFFEDAGLIPVLHEILEIEIPGYASSAGSKIFLRPNLYSRQEKIPLKSMKRKSPIEIRRAINEVDTITFEFRGIFKPENEHSDCNLISDFGKYHSEIQSKDGKVIYSRMFSLPKGKYPCTDIEAFSDFLGKIKVEDEKQIVLTRIL